MEPGGCGYDLGLDVDAFLVLATGAFGVVHMLGTATAVKLFPPGWTRTGGSSDW